MEFAWDIPNVTFKWFKHSNELKTQKLISEGGEGGGLLSGTGE